MLNWFKQLMGLKAQKTWPTYYETMLASDVQYDINLIKSLKRDYDGVDDQLLLLRIQVEQRLEAGKLMAYPDTMEDGTLPVYMGWEDEE